MPSEVGQATYRFSDKKVSSHKLDAKERVTGICIKVTTEQVTHAYEIPQEEKAKRRQELK